MHSRPCIVPIQPMSIQLYPNPTQVPRQTILRRRGKAGKGTRQNLPVGQTRKVTITPVIPLLYIFHYITQYYYGLLDTMITRLVNRVHLYTVEIHWLMSIIQWGTAPVYQKHSNLLLCTYQYRLRALPNAAHCKAIRYILYGNRRIQ